MDGMSLFVQNTYVISVNDQKWRTTFNFSYLHSKRYKFKRIHVGRLVSLKCVTKYSVGRGYLNSAPFKMELVLSALVILLSVIVCLPLFKSYRKNKFFEKCFGAIPTEKWYPIFGSAYRILSANHKDRWNVMKSRHKIYGPIFRGTIGPTHIVYLSKAEHLKVILRSYTNIKKGRSYNALKPWLGDGLISGGGEHWKFHRKVIRPAFYVTVLDKYMDVFSNNSSELLDIFEQKVGQGYFDVFPLMTQLSLETIAETAMGVKLNFMKNPKLEYPNAILNYLYVAIKRMFNPLTRNEFLFKLTKDGKYCKQQLDIINSFNRKIIRERREHYENHKDEYRLDENSKTKMAFLDLLLACQETSSFTDQEVEEEVNTFMFGGQDTTAFSNTYTLMALGNNLDVQRKVQEEIDSIFHGDERPVTSEDCKKMEYMERVIKESLRCYTIVPFISRELEEEVEIDGFIIPKGVGVLMSLYDLHQDPEQFPEPEKFDPDRFLPENVAKRHPFAFAPFSAGPRNCIGQNFAFRSVKTTLTHILRRYNVKCLEKPEEVEKYYEIGLRPVNGIHISLERRH
ncbi:cytochrome P450 4C1-like [Rhynchophorus ferrugineus]|uniref:cytochrome P450 4C1-like n=1 Tax=Rhynchophorus ferrugineus TaxID=354439 RepID=UPI003FCD42B2